MGFNTGNKVRRRPGCKTHEGLVGTIVEEERYRTQKVEFSSPDGCHQFFIHTLELVAAASQTGVGGAGSVVSPALMGGPSSTTPFGLPSLPLGELYPQPAKRELTSNCACNAPKVWYQPFRGERHQVCEKCGKA